MSSPVERMVAIVDCESFYASCERVFDPGLAGKPIVVLSNNDGCVVASNQEAKAHQIPMGTPWLKLERYAHRNGIIAKSSNYELYGALSARIMEIIGRYAAWQEVYSIDESFIGLRGDRATLERVGRQIRAEVMRCTGIQVRVGIAPSKTLAKLAILGVKADPSLKGVCHLGRYGQARLERIMGSLPVTDLWGVAGRSGKKLAELAIHTVKDLRDADAKRIRQRFSVVLERTVMELRGFSCIPVESGPRAYKDQLIFSRSFSRPVSSIDEMRQVLSIYAQKVSGRLRAQGQGAGVVSAWASTSPFAQSGFAHSGHVAASMPAHTDDPIWIGKAAHRLLPKLHPEARYVRAGVVLTDLRPLTSATPLELFAFDVEGRHVGDTLDRITRKLGRAVIGVGYGGLKDAPVWEMKREMLSPRAMTHWGELCEVFA